jgi:predicted regulator of Ras-like GTPase activity (Roadblock/LC7/MglB family)
MKSTQDLIEEELLVLCQQGKFEAFLLFSTEGIPMAGVDFSDRFNADGLAALSVVLNQSVELTEEFQENTIVDEVSLRISSKHRIVSRPFNVDDVKMVLVAIVPHRLPYRRITTTAINRIQQIF